MTTHASTSEQRPPAPWGDDDSQRPVRLAELLARVSREALQGEGIDAVLRRIVDCLVQRLPVALASIVLLNDAGTAFVNEVWAGELELDQPQLVPSWPVSVGAAGRCARLGVAQLITDVDQDPDYVPGNCAVRAEYLVPIRHGTRLHGVLNIESTRSDFFTHDACLVFDAIADQVAGAIHLARLAAELEAANRKLAQLSMSDGLTGIANRRCFDQRLALEWQRAPAGEATLALLLVDADNFKALNDACGHLHGDECLRVLARLCSEALEGDRDLVARYGGEELVLLLPGRDLRAARRLAERLRARVQAAALPHPDSAVAAHVTVSIGVAALVASAATTPEELILAADHALYAAKARGKNRVAGVARRADRIRAPLRTRLAPA
ncbi:GGDEF domain-containing protein [Cognatiluteimonas telluris]|jgi:diguanylate cyclase (GGDEF)-like protein|uniref:GGDEF domain-containing protein n=1 Tax=Cognatiluteimonas telluris TaxID=1104775 RepID=UPI00140E7A47|nr:diguanylate cyclase [Lysobacter telluris]